MELTTKCRVSVEIRLNGNGQYDFDTALKHEFYGVFRHRASGITLRLPGFYYGQNIFCLRFAPTKTGIWDFTVESSYDFLASCSGTVDALPYDGELEIYKRGFLKTDKEHKYFMYADGTPFFYLGDTHWGMYKEEFDSPGAYAKNIKTDSHFKYIVDKRVEQGFTVYQSEPLGAPFDLTDGFDENDLEGFRIADEYYRYIAEKGLVHANAEFFFPTALTEEMFNDTEYIKLLCRHWVARYGSFPVMWTLAQEIDGNDYNPSGNGWHYSCWKNPWVKIAEYIHGYDAYSHPLSAHQHGTCKTTVTGRGSEPEQANDGIGMSAFFAEETFNGNFAHGHSWWAAQWGFKKDRRYDDEIPKDYWVSDKPAVMYESLYCCLWTKNYGARVQGWVAFLSGMCGYGYGAGDIWLYDSEYSSGFWDGVDNVLPADKALRWSDLTECESALQVGYMKEFLNKYSWWTLTPEFYDGNRFEGAKSCYFAAATRNDELYIIYAYNKNRINAVGTLKQMDKAATYSAWWYDPRNNEYTLISDSITPNGDGSYDSPYKPDNNDWVLLVIKNRTN